MQVLGNLADGAEMGNLNPLGFFLSLFLLNLALFYHREAQWTIEKYRVFF